MNPTLTELETELHGRKTELAGIRQVMANAYLAGDAKEARSLGIRWHEANLELSKLQNRIAIAKAELFRQNTNE